MIPHRFDPRASLAAAALEDSEERDVVLFAAGAVELRVPLGWKVYEAPYGRELRVAITPAEERRRRKMPRDGLWLAYHVLPAPGILSDAQAKADLQALLPARLRLATKGRATSQGRHWQAVDGFWIVREHFAVAQDTDDAQRDRQTKRVGWHALARTPWGVMEMHAIGPMSLSAQRQAAWESVFSSLRLSAPDRDDSPIDPAVRAAAAALGSWKAYRSRLRLMRNGRIEIVWDRPGGYAIDEAGQKQWRAKLRRLTGRFEAHDDVLQVFWDDGSQLNFRWRLHEGELLLTDHFGQVSQLRRFYE